jgi:HK97 family phage major capsid protein
MASINEMRADRARIFEEAKSLVERAESEGRDLSGEEQAAWEQMNSDIDELGRQINIQERQERIDVVRASLDVNHRPASTPTQDFNQRFQRFLHGEMRSFTITADDMLDEKRQIVTGSAPGSHAVPISFVNRLREHLIENSAVRQANPTVLNTSGGEDLRVPKTTAHPTAALVDEAAAIGTSTPTLATVTLEAYKYANLFQVSREFLQDEAVNILDYLARINGQALGNISGQHFVVGDGSDKPRGIVTAAGNGKTHSLGTGDLAESLIDLQHSIVSGYRRNAYWLMSDATLSAVRKLREGSDGNFIWQPGLQAGVPDLLLGRPVVTDPNVPAMSGTNKFIVYGDFSGYYIRDVQSVSFERSDDYAFNTDLVTFRAIIRTDGDLVDENAVKAATAAV